MPSPVFALTGWSAWKSPRRGGGVHLLRDVAGLQPVDLVERDHDRHAEREDALSDEAIAGADPLACREDEHDAFDVLERRVDRALHPLRRARRAGAGSPAGRRG